MSQFFELILDKAIKYAIETPVSTTTRTGKVFHTENLYGLSTLRIKDTRYSFAKWLKKYHPELVKDNYLLLPDTADPLKALEVFEYAGIHCFKPMRD